MSRGSHTADKSGNMNFQELITQLWVAHSWKAAVSIVATFVGYHLLPIASFIAVGVALVASDFITGLTASFYRKDAITSRRMARTVLKIIFYSAAIVMVHVVEEVFFKTDTRILVYMVSAYISIVELYSNLENISTITETNIIGMLKRTLRERFPAFTKHTDDTSNDNDQPTGS